MPIKFVVRLDRNQAHVLAFDGSSDSFGTHKVVLVELHERSRKPRCDQTNIRSLFEQRTSQKVGARADIQAAQPRLHVRWKRWELLLIELLALDLVGQRCTAHQSAGRRMETGQLPKF
jgi:hypothetical protein